MQLGHRKRVVWAGMLRHLAPPRLFVGPNIFHINKSSTIYLIIMTLYRILPKECSKNEPLLQSKCISYSISNGGQNSLSGGWGQPPPTSVGRSLTLVLWSTLYKGAAYYYSEHTETRDSWTSLDFSVPVALINYILQDPYEICWYIGLQLQNDQYLQESTSTELKINTVKPPIGDPPR